EVERTAAGLVLRDLGSRNGTWIEGRRIVTAYVEPGDKIQLGKTKIAVKQQSRGTEIEIAGGESFGDLVGASDAMRAVFSEPKRVNCRIVGSSARNLLEEIEQERFRKDLYFRLAVAKVRMPPLRTRKADIPVIAQVLVKKLGTQIELSAQTLSLLEGYDWPGN